jgi:hypothetical protein
VLLLPMIGERKTDPSQQTAEKESEMPRHENSPAAKCRSEVGLADPNNTYLYDYTIGVKVLIGGARGMQQDFDSFSRTVHRQFCDGGMCKLARKGVGYGTVR